MGPNPRRGAIGAICHNMRGSSIPATFQRAVVSLGSALTVALVMMAAPPSVGVLVLVPEGSARSISEIYGATRRALETETVVRVAPLDVFSMDLRQDMVRTCAADPECFLRLVRRTRMTIDELLIVSLSSIGDVSLVAARWLSVGGRREARSHAIEANPGGTLDEAMQRVLPKVVPPGAWGYVASVDAVSDPPGAVATLRERSCVTPCRFGRLVPGDHDVSFALEGHRAAAVSTRASPKSPAVARVTLEPVATTEWYESPWVWVAVGVGLAGASVGAYFAADIGEPPPERVCIHPDTSRCP